jgi:membrane protease YdiL (CAAX protease family)
VTTLLFAAEHALGGWTWWQALFGSGVGALLFGAAALRTRGLAVPIGLHAAWNFGDTMLGGKGTPGFWKPVVDSNAIERVETAQWAIYVVVMIVAAAAIWFWPRGVMKTGDR